MRQWKTEAVKRLEQQAYEVKRAKSTMPEHAIIKPKYSEKDANGLTRCIVDYINLQPVCFAYRVNNGAVYDPKLKRHRQASTIKGIADVTAIKNGKTWQIEIKKGRDKLSDYQKQFAEKVEQAGGVYCVAYSFDSFLNRWDDET